MQDGDLTIILIISRDILSQYFMLSLQSMNHYAKLSGYPEQNEIKEDSQ
jgi:hypothetical protein